MSKKTKKIDVAVIIPDASPILTLHRIGRLDILGLLAGPIRIVDQVHFEVTKPANDPTGEIAQTLRRMGNSIDIVETTVGAGFASRRARDPRVPSRNLGELAVSEYAIELARQGAKIVPLVLYEDPDMETLPVFRQPNVHFLNTTALLLQLFRRGALPEGKALISQINASRKTRMAPIDRPYRTKKVRSQWKARKGESDGNEDA